MKSTLAMDKNRGLYRCDVGPQRFYLGDDVQVAQARKEAIGRLWRNCRADGMAVWDFDTLAIAKQLAKGERPSINHRDGESGDAFAARESRIVKLVGGDITPALNLADIAGGVQQALLDRIAQLEDLIREKIGPGAATGSDVKLFAAIDEWCAYRATNDIDPDTGRATEWSTKIKTYAGVIKRVISDMPLSALQFTEIERWCKAIANRPKKLNSDTRISRATVRNCLKLVRMFIRWASRYYNWKKPDDWQEATSVMPKRTAEERHQAKSIIAKHYTAAEIGTLWKFALPSERMLILLGLNFGFAQQEILNIHREDLEGEETYALRGKSEVLGKWIIWPETRELARSQFDSIPSRRQHIANRWNHLLDRVARDVPGFKRLSFKWLRKTGSSMIRELADGETASLYLSHGERAATDDDLLEVYASANWDRVCSTLRLLRERLLPHLQASAVVDRTYLPRTKIDLIVQSWNDGKHPNEIITLHGVSRATAYRYRPRGLSDQSALGQNAEH